MNTYHQTIQSKLVSCLIGVFQAILWIVVIKLFLPAVWLQPVFIAFVLIGLFLEIPTILFFGKSITISVDGIEYRLGLKRMCFRLKIGWNGFRRIGRFGFTEGLFINNHYFLRLTHSFLPDWETYSNFATYFFIPLSIFSENWCDSELGQQIKQYAPHLFQ